MSGYQWVGLAMVAVPVFAFLSWQVYEEGWRFTLEVTGLLAMIVVIPTGVMFMIGAFP